MVEARKLMRKLQTLVLVVFGFFITAVSLHAQTYPVQGSAFLIPPYSLRLSDYATSTSERLAMNVLLTDVARAELRIRFRLHIEGPTISIDSKAEYIGNPVTLQGGISLRLTNLDLSEYFNLQNIHFTGISEREFLQKGTLPEGLYRICFDVLEYNRGVKISQSICAQAFFVLNDPPIINLPRQGETLRAQMPQNVIMQWTPRHTGSPNSAFNTQYEIKVVEVWPADRNPNDAILTQPAIYETTTATTSLIYGPDATQLEPGRTYAFRVRAVPMGVADQLDLFKNNGYSETVSFVYGQACKPPATVTGKVTGPHTLTLDWTQDSNHTAYKVHFRKQGSHDWRLQRASINTADLKDLEANSNYEYEVGAVCGDFESLYSPIGELKTMEAQTPLYECGAQPKGSLNTNQEPLPELKVGDKVHTLTVEVTITKVTGGNGIFSGEAEARMKIFNRALMRLTYKDIRVNKDYWLIGGYFEAVSGGVDLPGDTREGLDVLGDILSESQGGGSSNDYKAPPPDTTTFVAQETITIPDGIQSITKDERTGLVTVTDTKGVKHDLPQGKDVAVADENGRGALVDKQGQITNTTAEQAKAAGKREYGFSVVFEKATESKAGFDKYDGKTTALKNTYQKIEEYIVPWKAVGTGTDVVKGNLNFGTAKDLLFEQEGARLTYNEFTNILTVNSVPAGSTAQVIVKEKVGGKEKIRGKLNVAGYTSMSKTVHLIPVNNATCTISEADLKTYLDNVYGQALVSWQVDIKNKIDVSFTGDFDDGGSGLLSTYTGDMRKVISAYGSMEQEQYYIFLIDRGKTKTGYMPRGKRAGFVFLNSQNGEELKHTIAHELGHGAFTLRHPFAEYPTVTEKSTDNLMDYAGGNHLYKWQWDQIHNPVLVLGLFEGDSEGGNISTNTIPNDFADDNTFNFITITGKKITLPKQCVVNFNYGIINANDVNSPLSYLHSFKVRDANKKEVEYTSKVDNGNFLGFVDSKNSQYTDILTSKNNHNNVILFIPEKEGICFMKFGVNLPPYTVNAPCLTYETFPIKPYANTTLLKKSETRRYEAIRGVIKNQSEDWALHKDFLQASLAQHDKKPEYIYLIKIAELRTAYRTLFEQFTDPGCYGHWSIDLTKTITNGIGTAGGNNRTVSCQGVWEETLRKDNPLLSMQTSNPTAFYQRFITDFLTFIQTASSIKGNFLGPLSLNTTQEAAAQFLSLCSNDEISKIPWEKRKILLQVLARRDISGDGLEQNIVRLAKYIPAQDQVHLLDALTTLKDADNKTLLIKKYLGGLISDLNGENFYEFVSTIHQYAQQKYRYDNSVMGVVQNKKKNRFFSFDPSFWASKPVSIEIKDNGKIQLAFRSQFWVSTYSSIEVDPYESVTLHFKDRKNTNEFSLNESDVYTTSGIMAYALCGSVQSSNVKILGFTALNTVLLFTGIGEFNAALQAGRAGRMAWAAADVGLGLGGILIETKYKDQLTQTENGRTVLKIWEGLNLLYGGARITLELYNLCKSSRDAISQLKKEATESGEQETLVALNETETQVNNVEKSGVGSPISFFEGGGNDWSVFSKIKMKITSIDSDGWLMGKYVSGELQVIGNTKIAQKWDYIVKSNGEILVGRKHSWLSQGEDVLAAGELKYNNGTLVEISNASGHYLPSTAESSNFLRLFRKANVNVDNATLTIIKEDGTIFKQVTPTSGDRRTYY